MSMSVRCVQVLFILVALACFSPWFTAPAALVAGCVFVQLFGNPFARESQKISSLLLKLSIVGLGFGMNLGSAMQVGKDGFWLTLASVTLILTLGFFVGSRLNMPRRLSHLLAAGTAICGGSAIAAVGPAVKATAQEMSVALGVIFALNAVALVLFPVIGHWLGLDQYHFGLWCAIAIHDTSSVVGAASAYGAQALDVAVTAKLARALWLIPVTLLSALAFKSGRGKPKVPLFIVGFVLAMLANTWLPLPEALTAGLVTASKAALVLCLFLIGTALSLEALRAVGWKPLILGIFLWLVISLLSLPAIMYMT